MDDEFNNDDGFLQPNQGLQYPLTLTLNLPGDAINGMFDETHGVNSENIKYLINEHVESFPGDINIVALEDLQQELMQYNPQVMQFPGQDPARFERDSRFRVRFIFEDGDHQDRVYEVTPSFEPLVQGTPPGTPEPEDVDQLPANIVSPGGPPPGGPPQPPFGMNLANDFGGGKRKTKKSKKSRKSRAKKRSKNRITRRTRIKKGGMDDEQPTMKPNDIQHFSFLLIQAIESKLDSYNDIDAKVKRVDEILTSVRPQTRANLKAVVNTKSPGSPLALHAAARRGNGEMIRLLLKNGADANARNHNDETPLHYASFQRLNGHNFSAHNARVLVEEGGADIDAKSSRKKTPLDIAREEENSSVERYLEGLLKEKEEAKLSEEKEKGMDDEQPTMKIDEIQGHRIRLMNTINSVLDYKFTMDLKVENVRLILNSLGTPANRKAVLNTNSDGSQLPLHAVALRGNGEMVRLLLDKGADANVRNISNETPLHYAARYGPSFTRGNARILVEEGGADIDAEDLDGKKPLDIARDEENSSVEEYLEGLLKERGRGYASRFRRRFEPLQIEETIKSAIDSRHSRPARTYRVRKDDEENEDSNKVGFTPKPPGNRGGKRKTKKSKKTKKNKKTKKKGRK